MKVAARIGRESFVQALGFLVQLADRLLIAALLIRIWGIEGFAAWSLITSAAGLLALFDFGVNLYFANRLLFLIQQGKQRAARAVLRGGNLLMILASVIGVVAVAIGAALIEPREGGWTMSAELWASAVLLALATFFRSATAIQLSLYRAHERYARMLVLLIGGDAARMAVTVGGVLLGGSFLTVTAAICLVSFLAALVTLIDSRRLFPSYPFAIGALPRPERKRALNLSLGFWLFNAPSTAITYLPVVFLTGVASAAALAQFVLMRTLANFVRAVLQPFSVIFAQESGRRVALGDRDGLASTYRESTFLLGALGAIPAGLLIALGPELFALWTGRPDLFSYAMLVLAIGPPLLLPSLNVATNYLATINDSWPIAIGRGIQLAIALFAYVLLPIDSPGLRMMAALALAEPLGMGLLMSVRAARTVPASGVIFHLEMLARLAAVLAGTWGGAVVGAGLTDDRYLSPLAGIAAGGAAGAVMTMLVGLERKRRSALIAIARRRLLMVGGKAPPGTIAADRQLHDDALRGELDAHVGPPQSRLEP